MASNDFQKLYIDHASFDLQISWSAINLSILFNFIVYDENNFALFSFHFSFAAKKFIWHAWDSFNV
jgi:hypothetical protein